MLPVNENDPVWGAFNPVYTSATAPYNINEDVAVGTTVVTLAATDADSGSDGDITYSISTVTAGGWKICWSSNTQMWKLSHQQIM